MRQDRIEPRCAIEALRAGIPNRDVVRQLPPLQQDLESRLNALLEEAEAGWESGRQAPGILLEGEFGTGKSHWLEYARHRALEEGFVCSTVVLNKETPLHDLGKIYRASVEAAAAPGKLGPALDEIAHGSQPESLPLHREMMEWAHNKPGLDPRFAATLMLFERSPNDDLRAKIVAEWTGYPMKILELRAALKEIGEAQRYPVARPQKGHLIQRFEFITRFFHSAGYAGWVVLFDEAEMVSRYSLRQRGRAYAHLSQLLGLDKATSVPGLATVFTITKDYTGQVLYGRKNDIEAIPARLAGTRDEPYIHAAQSGMNAIKGKGVDLRSPTRVQVDEVYTKVRAIYGAAYQWSAPDLETRREYTSSTGLRQYIRSWINAWDLRRLYDVASDVVMETVEMSYEEDTDLQHEEPDEEPSFML